MNNTDILLASIPDRKTVAFNYDDKERVVEVHAVGTSTKDGSVIMRGYQVAGESSRKLPAWALFTVDKIDALTMGFVPSEAPRAGYSMNDKQMDQILGQIELKEAA